MRHNLTIDGFAFRLRPIGDADAPFVLKLRTNPQLNQYLHTTSHDIENQLAWLRTYYTRPGDYYFVIERLDSAAPEGVVAIYDIDTATNTGEWGRWILNPGSLAAIESAGLIYKCAFERLMMHEIFCRTVENNQPVVSFHDSCGITSRRILPEHFDLNGKLYNAVEHRLDAAGWNAIRPRLEKLAQMTARRLQHA